MKDEEENRGMKSDLGERTKVFALRIVRQFVSLPRSEEALVLGRQMLRSGTSVGANYREANRARSNAEFIAKIGDCLKELDETGYWLELIVEAEISATKSIFELIDECDELLAIFTTISKKAKRNE